MFWVEPIYCTDLITKMSIPQEKGQGSETMTVSFGTRRRKSYATYFMTLRVCLLMTLPLEPEKYY